MPSPGIHSLTWQENGQQFSARVRVGQDGQVTVIDADEAAIDNSEFERDLALSPDEYDEDSWNVVLVEKKKVGGGGGW